MNAVKLGISAKKTGLYTPSTGLYTPSTGVPFRIIISGVLCERVSLDGVWLTIDGMPVYMEV